MLAWLSVSPVGKSTVPSDRRMQKPMSSLLGYPLPFHAHLGILAAQELSFLFGNVRIPTRVSRLLTVLWVLCSQTADAELPSPPADRAARHPGRGQLLPYAHLHDVQRVPLHRGGRRGRDGLFLLQLEKGRCGGYHGALPLTPGAAQEPLHPAALLKCSHRQDWIIPKRKEKQ